MVVGVVAQTPAINRISTNKQGNTGNNIQMILTTFKQLDSITAVESEADDLHGVVDTVAQTPAINTISTNKQGNMGNNI